MLHAGRAKEKRDKIIARLKMEEEMKAELRKARMQVGTTVGGKRLGMHFFVPPPLPLRGGAWP